VKKFDPILFPAVYIISLMLLQRKEYENFLGLIDKFEQDLEILYLKTNCIPTNIFDTQIAASFLEATDSISYETLVNKYLNIAIDIFYAKLMFEC
jgi:ribonuclease D